MATRKPATRRKTTTTRRKTTTRKAVTRKPRRGGFWQRRAVSLAQLAAKQGEKHTTAVRSRKDAAILRATHAGCTRCGGTGTLYTQSKKTGAFTGSKPCPAKPTVAKVSRTRVAVEARFGPDKTSGLIGWNCPCGKREKPRYRDAKTATTALRTHERQKHGGTTVGGGWYAQVPASTAPSSLTKTA